MCQVLTLGICRRAGRQVGGTSRIPADIRSQRWVLAYRTLVGGARVEVATLEGGAGIYWGQRGEGHVRQ